MRWVVTPYSYIYLLAGLITLVTAAMNWSRRNERGMRPLAWVVFCVAVWCFACAIEMAAVGRDHKIFWVTVQYVVSDLIANFTLFFVLEYHDRKHWLTPWRLAALWLVPVLNTLLLLTNSAHHLIWTGFVPGPPGSNLLFFEHGPLYYVAIVYQSLLLVSAIGILAYAGLKASGRARHRTCAMAASLSAPVLTSLAYYLLPAQLGSFDLMPLGFTTAALLVSMVAFRDMQRRVVERTVELERLVGALREEVATRMRLEADLREAQDKLTGRLVDQNRTLIGLYNLITMASQSEDAPQLLHHIVGRIRSVLRSDAVCFLRAPAGAPLHLEAYDGTSAAASIALQSLPGGWLDPDSDVRVDMRMAGAPGLPEPLRRSGFGACLFKSVALHGGTSGVLGALWQAERDFSVEDIALFSVLGDGLAVILENARLRESLAEAAIAQERRRLSRDLHDSVMQLLYGQALAAETARHCGTGDPERLGNLLAHIDGSAKQAVKEMRLVVYELGLPEPEASGFLGSLQARLQAVEQRAGVAVRLDVAEDAGWPPAWDSDLYLMVTEALNNALKHAHATGLSVNLSSGDHALAIEIADNGCGFDPSEAAQVSGGMGLQNIAARAARLGGRVELHSEIGAGTRIRFLWDALP